MKKNKIIVILVIILIILAGAGVTIGILSSEQYRKIDDNKAQELVEKYYHSQFLNFFDSNYVESEKALMAILKTESVKESIKDLDAFECSNEVQEYNENMHCTFKNNENLNSDFDAYVIKYDNANAKYKELFATDTDIPKNVELAYLCSEYVYNDEIDAFIDLTYIPCGVVSGPRYDLYSLDSIEYKGKELIITITYMFTDGYLYVSGDQNLSLYKTDSDIVTYVQQDKLVYLPEVVDHYTDNLSKYEFRYKLEDKNYKLSNVVKK